MGVEAGSVTAERDAFSSVRNEPVFNRRLGPNFCQYALQECFKVEGNILSLLKVFHHRRTDAWMPGFFQLLAFTRFITLRFAVPVRRVEILAAALLRSRIKPESGNEVIVRAKRRQVIRAAADEQIKQLIML